MVTLPELRASVLPHAGQTCHCLPRLRLYCSARPSELAAFVYDPVVCFVLQGSKRTIIGAHSYDYGAGECMVVTAEITALGQILTASPEAPYLALNLHIDAAIVSDALLDLAALNSPGNLPGFDLTRTGPMLLDAWSRAAELFDKPETETVASAIERELLYRLLTGPQGPVLRQIARPESRLPQIRRAMEWIRTHYMEQLTVDAMATIAGMSVSGFHRRFKAVAGTSPLEYQKHVRLHEARRRLVSDRAEAATVAYAVGYESASQFKREYKRLFGLPLRRDAKSIQATS